MSMHYDLFMHYNLKALFSTIINSSRSLVINIYTLSIHACTSLHDIADNFMQIVIPVRCSCLPGQLLLVSRSGTILGGTPVRVYGPCAQEPTGIKCVFDTEEVEGKYYPDQGQFVCVTPRFQKTGRVQFTLTFTSKSGEKQTHSSIFSVGKFIL